MKPYAIHPPMTPPDDPPDPDLTDALPCICGWLPDWDRNVFKDFRLFCYRHCVDGPWKSELDKAIQGWNDAVTEKGDDEGLARKAEGQTQVAEHNEAWIDLAVAMIQRTAASRADFTTDDFRSYCNAHAITPPKHPNAWGAAFSAAAKQGLIEKVGYRKSTSPSAHARVVTVWRSVK